MSETFNEDTRKALGQSILGHLVERGIVEEPPEPEEEPTGPSPMENLHAIKKQHQDNIAGVILGQTTQYYQQQAQAEQGGGE